MIHGHGTLRDGMHGEFFPAHHLAFKGRIPEGNGIEVGFNPGFVLLRYIHLAVPLCRQAELLQGFRIELVDDGLRPRKEAKERCPIQIVPVHVAIIFHVVAKFLKPV